MVLAPIRKLIAILCALSSLYADRLERVVSTEELLNEGVLFYQIYAPSILDLPPYPLADKFYPSKDSRFLDPLTLFQGGVPFPYAGVLALEGANVYSDTGLVLIKNRLLDFTAEYFYAAGRAKERAQDHPIMGKQLLQPIKKNETIAVLATRNYNNYYGWLFGLLPRYHLLLKSNVNFDRLYLPPITRPFQKQTLELLGISSEDPALFQASPDTFFQGQTLLVPTMAENRKQYPAWVINFLRESFLPCVQPTGRRKRIIIGRKSRGFANEKALLDSLKPLGFENYYLEKLSFLEQLQLFSEAECVIGVHGAGFANVVFCPKDVLIIEVFNQGWLSPTFWGISQHLGQRHHCLLSEMNKLSKEQKQSFNSYAPIQKIVQLLQDI